MGSESHELGNGGEIPVGVRDLGMAEVGRENGDLAVDVDPLLGPAQEAANRERVAEVVDARQPCASLSSPSEPATYLQERPLDGHVRKGGGVLRAQEGLRARRTARVIATSSVV